MLLRALGSEGSITGTNTITCSTGIFGGALITADGTNDATVIIRRTDSNGKILFKVVTKAAGFHVAPIDCEGTQTIYYSISGTGAAAQLFEWAN